MSILIRPAVSEDAKAIGELSREFSDYLRSLGDAETAWISSEVYLRDGFGLNPAFSGLAAEHEGKVVGYLLYHQGYDTDYLTRILYIIDLYIQSTWRRQGVGSKLIEGAADICRAIGGTQMIWSVYIRNETALAFYQSLGARFTENLVFMRLDV